MTTIPPNAPHTEATQPHRKEIAQATSDIVSPKDTYRRFCAQTASLPLFSRDWWLDAAVGRHGWDVALVKKGSEVLAAMPYVIRSRYGMKIVTQPALTPILGPWLLPTGGRQAAQLSNDKEVMQALIDQLPRFDHFAQTWHPGVRNWQPFFWNGFRQTTYYTFVLQELTDVDKMWAGFEGKTRRAITKAQKQHQLQVRSDVPLDVLLDLNRKTFARQGLSPPYSDDFVRRLDAACRERDCSKLFCAIDPDGAAVAACYIVWDEDSAYGLISGTDPAYRGSEANSLCVWESLLHAAGVTRQYNFCGSMIEPFEGYLRGFGGKHVPYFHISKTPSRLLTLRQGLLSLAGKH
ncbi:Acetyltransferase (GNAT) domain-containing protein [Massilia sp. PDC64]|nr:GNAT family N-acetyltransferase [Massilia sp. PDC64]SDD48560.1 Acetyltransferase (GNAT) domain-containing protein [Massilia sp. PDC64]